MDLPFDQTCGPPLPRLETSMQAHPAPLLEPSNAATLPRLSLGSEFSCLLHGRSLRNNVTHATTQGSVLASLSAIRHPRLGPRRVTLIRNVKPSLIDPETRWQQGFGLKQRRELRFIVTQIATDSQIPKEALATPSVNRMHKERKEQPKNAVDYKQLCATRTEHCCSLLGFIFTHS